MALLYVSQELFILFPLFYQVDSFSFFYSIYATPPSLPVWFLCCFNDEQEYCKPFIEVLVITHFHIILAPRGFIALYPVCLNLEYSLIIDKAR